jgi:hypothetical protein
MFHLTTTGAFPRKRPVIPRIAEQRQRFLRIVANSFQNVPNLI